MRLILLLMVLVFVGQEPQVGAPPDGPFAFKEGHLCWKQPDQTYGGRTFHECHCKVVTCVDDEAAGGKECLTYCGTKQCVCHSDEPCNMDQDPQSPASQGQACTNLPSLDRLVPRVKHTPKPS